MVTMNVRPLERVSISDLRKLYLASYAFQFNLRCEEAMGVWRSFATLRMTNLCLRKLYLASYVFQFNLRCEEAKGVLRSFATLRMTNLCLHKVCLAKCAGSRVNGALQIGRTIGAKGKPHNCIMRRVARRDKNGRAETCRPAPLPDSLRSGSSSFGDYADTSLRDCMEFAGRAACGAARFCFLCHYTIVPNKAPTTAVTTIASAPQNVTRLVAFRIGDPPVRAARTPRAARKARDIPNTAGTKLDWGTIITVRSAELRRPRNYQPMRMRLEQVARSCCRRCRVSSRACAERALCAINCLATCFANEESSPRPRRWTPILPARVLRRR